MLRDCLWIPELKTDRLVLRKLTACDAEDLREWLGRDELYKYWGRAASKGEKNPELLFIDPRPNVSRKPTHDFIWGIELEHKIVGMIEVFDVENDRLGKVGYRVSPDRQNEGICTEALRRAVKFIFEETALDRLHAEADVNNIASNSVLRKCGFVHEGTVRHGKMGTRFCDYNIYGMIRDDFDRITLRKEAL